VFQRQDFKRELQALASRRYTFVKQAQKKSLYNWLAWIWTKPKASDFNTDE
jgi:hypothetical protein